MATDTQKALSANLATAKKALLADIDAAFKRVEADVLRTINTSGHTSGPAVKSKAPVAKAKPGSPTKKSAKAVTVKTSAKANGDFLVNADGTPVLNKDGTPRKRPGPPKGFGAGVAKAEVKASAKKGSAPAPKKQGAPAKKITAAAPAKSKVVVKAKSSSGKTQTVAEKISATKQAQKQGNKPTLKEGLITVMQEAGGSLGIKEATEALNAKGWLPNSEKPEQYIGSVLSAESKPGGLFEKVEGARGKYRVSKKAGGTKSHAKATIAAKTEKHEKTNGASSSSVDDMIRESGILEATP